MVDPLVWAMTPGMGRAPLLYPQAQPAANPIQAMAQQLATGNNQTRAGDRPVGAIVRDPSTMSQRQQIAEMMALGGFPQEGTALAGRAPATIAGGLSTLAGAPVPGIGTLGGMMARTGMEQRQRQLAGDITQGMADAYESGTHQRDPNRGSFIDAYEAGRQAAVISGGGQTRDQEDIERAQRGSRDTQHAIAI